MVASDISPNENAALIGVGIVFWKGENDTFWRNMGEVPKFEWTPNVDTVQWFSHQGPGVKTLKKTFVIQQTGTLDIDLQEGTGKNWALAAMATEEDKVSLTSATFITTSGSTALTGLTPTSALVSNRRYNISGTGIPAGDTAVYNGGSVATLDAPASAAGTVSGSGTITSLGTKSMKAFSKSQINGSLMFVGNSEIGIPVIAEFRKVTLKPNGAIGFIQDGDLGTLSLQGENYKDAGGDFGHIDWDTDPNYRPFLGP